MHLDGYLKYHRYLEEDLEFKNMIELQTHLHQMQLGRGAPWTWTRLTHQALRNYNLSRLSSQLRSQNLHHDSASSELYQTMKKLIVHDYSDDAKLSKAAPCVSRGSRTTRWTRTHSSSRSRTARGMRS